MNGAECLLHTLTANGIDIPDVAGAVFSGTASLAEAEPAGGDEGASVGDDEIAVQREGDMDLVFPRVLVPVDDHVDQRRPGQRA